MRLLLLTALVCIRASAQLAVQIGDSSAVQLTAADLAKLPAHKVTLHDHGKDVEYHGPYLRDVLTAAKFDFGKGLHGKDLGRLVLAKAADDYQVVFALAELDPTLHDSQILLALKRGGEALGKNEGPLRIIVPEDMRPARSIRQLTEIAVKQARQ